jgi:hypothetical protein
LAEFVELPEEAMEGGLWFSNVLCGVLRGALEMVRAMVLSGPGTFAQVDCHRFKYVLKLNSFRMF